MTSSRERVQPTSRQLELSPTDIGILQGLVDGLNNQEIGKDLEIDPGVIGVRVGHIRYSRMRESEGNGLFRIIAEGIWEGLLSADKVKGSLPSKLEDVLGDLQMKVLAQMTLGWNRSQICQRLGIPEYMIGIHRTGIIEALEVKDSIQAVACFASEKSLEEVKEIAGRI